ncbi:uncharacterized protein LOC122309586 isoform X2 [Carya illinoinensis]|uniref:uncharacterized protein LOC122309586 isoform X2 n=1 Tax=Carya illinoinensis TaxID=32201 RepID=UPI001C721188|nr:uncharacterized protein LOC122309586 isoform X2 [Carya illinoinensis]
MIPFKLLLHQSSSSFSIPPNTPLYLYPPPPQFPNPALPPPLHKPTLSLRPNPFSLSIRLCNPEFRLFKVSKAEAPVTGNEGGYTKASPQVEDLSPDGAVYRKTLALVECSMFAALTGLVYFLSNSLAIENYFGCVFSLPIVISSMRWGIAAGRKTMVATAMLLLVLSGPVKALTYLLKHGIVGLTMGALWRFELLVLWDYNKHSCFSSIHIHCFGPWHNSLNEFYICLIYDPGFTEQWVLHILAPHFVFCVPH